MQAFRRQREVSSVEQRTAFEECFPNPTADSKYVRVDQRMDQTAATAYCREHYHDLAAIHNVQENNAVLAACQNAGASALVGDWVDQTGSFYQGSTITITEGEWTVTPPSYTDGDTLSLEKIGDAYSLTEHDGTRLDGTITDTAHDYHRKQPPTRPRAPGAGLLTRAGPLVLPSCWADLAVIQPDGTLKVTEEHHGHREWTLTR